MEIYLQMSHAAILYLFWLWYIHLYSYPWLTRAE